MCQMTVQTNHTLSSDGTRLHASKYAWELQYKQDLSIVSPQSIIWDSDICG